MLKLGSRAPPPPPIPLPFHFQPDNNGNGRYYEDDDDETPEYRLNLGAETPGEMTPSFAFAWETKTTTTTTTTTPARRRSVSSLRRSSRQRRDAVDRDCGICFESAVAPCRTLCCSKLFCLEHIADVRVWLHGSRSDGRCPSCKTRCTLRNDTILLPAVPHPHLHSSPTIPPTPTPITPPPRSPSTTSEESETSSDVGSETSDGDDDVGDYYAYETDTLDLSGTKVASKVLSIVGLTLVLYVLL
ncbi:uncharacterized protein BT62DRAFT_932618, partial [Guyanagaster necrorhizus]